MLDYNLLENTENSKGHLFIKHPKISGDSYMKFYLEMFNGFFPKAFFAYLDLFITNKPKLYMNKYGITESIFKNNYENNQLTNILIDSIIKENPHNYYNHKREVFYKRDSVQKFYPMVIHKKQKHLLKNISRTLKNKKTNFKIIISPLYDQKKINNTDLIFLKSIFGIKNVFDFSGKNKFTNDYMNYYETSHYRPNVSEQIMNIVYSNNN